MVKTKTTAPKAAKAPEVPKAIQHKDMLMHHVKSVFDKDSVSKNSDGWQHIYQQDGAGTQIGFGTDHPSLKAPIAATVVNPVKAKDISVRADANKKDMEHGAKIWPIARQALEILRVALKNPALKMVITAIEAAGDAIFNYNGQ